MDTATKTLKTIIKIFFILFFIKHHSLALDNTTIKIFCVGVVFKKRTKCETLSSFLLFINYHLPGPPPGPPCPPPLNDVLADDVDALFAPLVLYELYLVSYVNASLILFESIPPVESV